MKAFFITIFIVLSVYTTQAQLSGTYIVGGPNGDYPNPSLAIQALIQQGVNGPIVFKIYSGTYALNALIPPIQGSSTLNSITFVSITNKAEDVVLYKTASLLSQAFIILLDGVKYIKFIDIKFLQDGQHSGSIRIGNQSGWVNFENCIFSTPNASAGYSVIHSLSEIVGDYVVSGNYFSGGSGGIDLGRGILTSYLEEALIEGNTIDVRYSGLFIANFDSTIIEKNKIICNFGNIVVGNNYFQVNNNLIIGRKSNSSIPTLSLVGGMKQGIVASNNMIISNSISSLELTSCSNLQFINNTIRTRSSQNYAASIKIEYNTNLNFQNNILVNDSSCFLAAIRNNSNSAFDYNVYYTQNDTIFYDGFGNNHTSLASWQIATGYDAHSVFVKPNFSKSNDVHLQANNPQIIGAGTPLTLNTNDIDGELRSTTQPDIGADEYSLRPILDSVVWGCAGSVVTLDAGAGFSSYHWSTNANTQKITVDTSGVGLGQVIYSVTVGYGGNLSSTNTKVVWQNCTGLLNYQQQEIDVKLFPNPSNGIVHINLSNGITNYGVYVYNSNGELIVKKKNVDHLNLSEYSKGLHFIQILTDESSVMRKLVLQ